MKKLFVGILLVLAGCQQKHVEPVPVASPSPAIVCEEAPSPIPLRHSTPGWYGRTVAEKTKIVGRQGRAWKTYSERERCPLIP